MGSGYYEPRAYRLYATASNFDTRSAEQVVNTTEVVDEFLPTNFKNGIRESRDNNDHPRSTPIIIAGDVTGSMGRIAGLLLKGGLDAFCRAMYDRQPVSDPQIMCMAVGDVLSDRVPIQCTQFESDIRIIQQLHRLYVEGNGGSNNTESYSLPWVVATSMVRTDAWDKRGEKGILFTYGDEEAPRTLTRQQIKNFLGLDAQVNIAPESALQAVEQLYDVYHLVIEQGNYARRASSRVYSTWRGLLGQRVIPVADYNNLSEIMVSVLEIARGGVAPEEVCASWGDQACREVVRHATASMVGA